MSQRELQENWRHWHRAERAGSRRGLSYTTIGRLRGREERGLSLSYSSLEQTARTQEADAVLAHRLLGVGMSRKHVVEIRELGLHLAELSRELVGTRWVDEVRAGLVST